MSVIRDNVAFSQINSFDSSDYYTSDSEQDKEINKFSNKFFKKKKKYLGNKKYSYSKCSYSEKDKKISSVNPVSTSKPKEARKDFRAYFDTYCKGTPSQVSFEQALSLVNEGRALFEAINKADAKTLKKIQPKTEKEAEKQMAAMAWFLTYQATTQGKGFTSGTFCIKNTKILTYFSPFLYPRLSSHYKERCKAHYGINIKRSQNQSLPVDKKTVLIGAIDIPTQKEPGVYIKLERNGCNINIISDKKARTFSSMSQTVKHGVEFVGHNLKNENLPVQRENIPSWLKSKFTTLLIQSKKINPNLCVKKEKKAFKKYGISYAYTFISNLKQVDKDVSETANFIKKKLINEYDKETLSYRKGDEVFIASVN